ncbi:MAG TPA: thioesterase family protein [Solirubrobacteraceae bacterium]|nr:thioesterase family protein [Solirubrobacteraceae bacterium]
MSAEAVFDAVDGGFVATELASGPWDPNAQIGGAPAALLARAFELVPTADGLILGRLTYDFIRPAPVGRVSVRAEVVRPGRRVQLLEGAMMADGVEVVRARALRVHRASSGGSAADAVAPPPGPDAGRTGELPGLHRPRFATDANDVRFVVGGFGGGPGIAWFRLTRPLVGGEEASPLQRLAAAADFGAGLSSALPREHYVFINVDMTVYVEREPVGEWVCLSSATRIADGGIGLTESVLFDQRGRVGHATQALLIAPH